MAKGGQARLMAHGQGPAWPRGSKGRPQVRARPRLPGSPGSPGSARPLAMSHERSLASLGHEP